MKKTLLTALLGLLVSSIYAQTIITDANAESKLLNNNDRLIVVDFYATWCAPCKRMAPIIKELEREYTNVDFYKIDVDKNNVDDALGINAMPTYLFIRNSSNLEQIEGAMSKTKMKSLLDKHLSTAVSKSTINSTYDLNDFSQQNIDNIWNSSSKLNSMAWNAYKEHDDINILLKSIKIVERSIELEKNYYNVDTHAALLYKTGNYTKALKKAKQAIEIAKQKGISYDTTSGLIDSIIDKL